MLTGLSLERRAFEICKEAHADAMYGDVKYFHHPLAVANMARSLGYSSFVIATCLLHDTVEDTAVTARYLYEQQIPLPVIWGVDRMTYTGKDQAEKIAQAMSTPLSHVGKFCDASKNKESCIASDDPRVEKYSRFVCALEIALPTPEDVDRYCNDFMTSSELLEAEQASIMATMRSIGTANAVEYATHRLEQVKRILEDQKLVSNVVAA